MTRHKRGRGLPHLYLLALASVAFEKFNSSGNPLQETRNHHLRSGQSLIR